ncbi:acyltransferase family protein [Microvirga flavescens]|uniref:acyltransferase family protein n=1 Tax=Microvirga flavescens TaxID=2249811 RepID=UPI001FDFA28B|nr:acyltransferase [Microvirga flavescens]
MSKLIHIQLLRALAALAVAFLHAQHDAADLAARLGFTFSPLDNFPWMAGVDVFFVISGFIMVYTSRDLFAAPSGRGIFLARRIARIVPLYWMVTTLYVVAALVVPVLVHGGLPSVWAVIASYLFIPFDRPGPIQPIYSLGWTLNYEMFFYALFAFVLVLRGRVALLVLAGALISFTLIGRVASLPQPFAFWTDPIILEFAFGIGLGWLRVQGVTLAFFWRALLAIAGVALLAGNVLGPPSEIGAIRFVAWGVPAALLVAAASLGPERPASANWLTRFGVRVGDVSYAIYLIHPFVMRSLSEAVARSGWGAVLGPWGFFALVLSGTLAASFAVHLWFERPVTAWLRRRLEPVRQHG